MRRRPEAGGGRLEAGGGRHQAGGGRREAGDGRLETNPELSLAAWAEGEGSKHLGVLYQK